MLGFFGFILFKLRVCGVKVFADIVEFTGCIGLENKKNEVPGKTSGIFTNFSPFRD